MKAIMANKTNIQSPFFGKNPLVISYLRFSSKPQERGDSMRRQSANESGR
jgi:hypothetical protein